MDGSKIKPINLNMVQIKFMSFEKKEIKKYWNG